ncbi:hypothetical protein BATDEDRAFT_87004 [Batrachochytrium dendrobatidis JAM81]|uniref:Pentacotripeptide-repeat region of PRORP domain-containing protein n=2 Tax=Batrachochytrium dendrobatidis TaxID=109871 RepID=F4NY07_BATDJ|nr:uncharacterized protein BATDEDRAFT_87004 [Batrachochytrium dendrobatidis JAM81]EGF82240.1 hypothetical protein BATDEDRAFT_87004 [Batrachochytrium dendrobatidis JAM81]OAJ40663.1 hypothetical protein BDEG_24370 [Batrachochytrium dendrobatidis JEL423]|eukprot:XP_006677676.1 hypothetical protein BATDEDRAFT_87004 [Batrachochytrium dendrobatidis JAM81]
MPQVLCRRPLRQLLFAKAWQSRTHRISHPLQSKLDNIQPFSVSSASYQSSSVFQPRIISKKPSKGLTTHTQYNPADFEQQLTIYARAGDDKSALDYLALNGHPSWTPLALSIFLKHFKPDQDASRFVQVISDLFEDGRCIQPIHCFIVADQIAAWPYGNLLTMQIGDAVIRNTTHLDPIGSLVLLLACKRTSYTAIEKSVPLIQNPTMRSILSLYIFADQKIPPVRERIMERFEFLQELFKEMDWTDSIYHDTAVVKRIIAGVMNAASATGDPSLVDAQSRWFRSHLPTAVLEKVSLEFDIAMLDATGVLVCLDPANNTANEFKVDEKNSHSDLNGSISINLFSRSYVDGPMRLKRKEWLAQCNTIVNDVLNQHTQPTQPIMDAIIKYLATTLPHQSGKFSSIMHLFKTFHDFEQRGYVPELENYHALLSCMKNQHTSIEEYPGRIGMEAVKVVYRMEAAGIRPTQTTYSLAFQAAAREATKYVSLYLIQFENHMISRGIVHNSNLVVHAIHAFCNGNCMDVAAQRLRDIRHAGIQPSLELYIYFLSACSQTYNFGLFALKELRWCMKRDGVDADVKAYALFIRCCVNTRDVFSAISICEEMKLRKMQLTQEMRNDLILLGNAFDENVQLALRDLM